jgi:response regulator of citrate/malate metabolism
MLKLWYNEFEMNADQRDMRQLTHEFFQYYPDYLFCRTLAFNIKNSVTTYEDGLTMLAKKARASQENRQQIDEKLDRRSVTIDGQRVPIKDLTLRQIMSQEDAVLKEILEVYCKNPYAHGRTSKRRFLPRWVRTIFLSTLLGHAKGRGLDLDYDAYFDMLTLV